MNAAIIDGLKTFLSDTYILYIKTQNFHWNVEGPQAGSLHAMFQTQYEDLRDAVDLVAERIRALGDYAPGSCSAFNEYSNITEAVGRPSSYLDMISELTRDHTMMASNGNEFVKKLQSLGDETTANIVVDRVDIHEKTAWLLGSHLKG